MRSKIVLAILATGVSLMFNGCATALQDNVQGVLNKIDAPFAEINKVFRPPEEVLYGATNISKNTDNLKPWEIKASDDTHYILDPFFALPTATSREDARQKIDKLLSFIEKPFMRYGIRRNGELKKLRGNCDVYATGIKSSKADRVFFVLERAPSCASGGGTHRFIQFKPLEVSGKWYMVVKNTNAKNSNALTFFKDVILEARANNYSAKGFIDPVYNYEISSLVTVISNKAIELNNWSNDYIDINLDSKDQRAKIYRDWFVNNLKKAFQ